MPRPSQKVFTSIGSTPRAAYVDRTTERPAPSRRKRPDGDDERIDNRIDLDDPRRKA